MPGRRSKQVLRNPSIFDTFQQIREDSGIAGQTTKENYEWFRKTINRNTYSEDYDQIRQQILTDPKRHMNRFLLGNLYFFFYNQPDYKTTLPFYDTFPLLLLMRRTKNHMFGINLHYIPPKRRLSVFLELLQFTNNKLLTRGTRIILPYEQMKREKRWKIFKSCFRQYKINNVQGKIINISAPDWPIAVNLPVERFKKMGKISIWQQTLAEEMS